MHTSSEAPVSQVRVGQSYLFARERFSRPAVAASYPRAYRSTHRDRRERHCISRALEGLPSGSSVLDLPCGSGRLLELLTHRGFQVTAADTSVAMLEHAQELHKRNTSTLSAAGPTVIFRNADVMQTQFADDEFDAVVCNRLFHHFTEAITRRQALAELRRICRGIIVLSFFNSFAMDALTFRLKHWARRTTPIDRIPIALSTFTADIHTAGLRIERKLATRWGISPMWYVVLSRAA